MIHIFSLVSFVFAFYSFVAVAVDSSVTNNTLTHIKHLTSTLNAQQQKQLFLPLNDDTRYSIDWWPNKRKGIALRNLTEEQQQLLRKLLSGLLSANGIEKFASVLASEAALALIEQAPEYRHPEKYYFCIFGNPNVKTVWALRFEGHHLSINITFRGSEIISTTPLFIGANPVVIYTPDGQTTTLLQASRDKAFALYNSLSPTQQQQAKSNRSLFRRGMLSRPGDKKIDTENETIGIGVSSLSAQHKQLVRTLIQEYVFTVEPHYARKYFVQLMKEEFSTLRFYFTGTTEPDENYYYRIVGKRLLIEQDNRSDGTHIHAIWRDSVHDFDYALTQKSNQ